MAASGHLFRWLAGRPGPPVAGRNFIASRTDQNHSPEMTPGALHHDGANTPYQPYGMDLRVLLLIAA
jgi:hypothetical protein